MSEQIVGSGNEWYVHGPDDENHTGPFATREEAANEGGRMSETPTQAEIEDVLEGHEAAVVNAINAVLEREHERGFEAGYSAAIHDATVEGSRAYEALNRRNATKEEEARRIRDERAEAEIQARLG